MKQTAAILLGLALIPAIALASDPPGKSKSAAVHRLGLRKRAPTRVLSDTNSVSSPSRSGSQPMVHVTRKPKQPQTAWLPRHRKWKHKAGPLLKPGVYLSLPYTAIIIVPGRHPDDQCIVGEKGPGMFMPTYRPPLHLVPWHEKREEVQPSRHAPSR